jgi:hypothetical protein
MYVSLHRTFTEAVSRIQDHAPPPLLTLGLKVGTVGLRAHPIIFIEIVKVIGVLVPFFGWDIGGH